MKLKKATHFIIGILLLSSINSCMRVAIEKKENDISTLPKHYILASATGNNDGSNWENAWTSLPEELEREHVYYIGDGEYDPYTFDDPEDGEKFIYILKAVETNHGTEEGWKPDYGDGQAIFESATENIITINSSYYDINGQVGKNKSNHGFRFSATTRNVNYIVVVGLNKIAEFTDIKIRYAEINNVSCQKDTDAAGHGFKVHSTASISNSLLQNCYLHDFPGMPIYYVAYNNFTSENNVVEHCYIARNHSCSALHHSEGMQSNGTIVNTIVRNNIWEDIEGTAVIVAKNGWKVYGNLFFYTENYPEHEQACELGHSGQGLGQGIVYGDSNNQVYNNTACGLKGVNAAFYFTGNNNKVHNNIWANCSRARFIGANADYNCIFNIADHGGYSEPNLQIFEESPFVNATGFNFHLLKESNPGIVLSDEYDKDMEGNTRGGDGVWTRGAFEN